MILHELISVLDDAKVHGDDTYVVHGVTADSRQVCQGDVFVVIKGFAVDGVLFVKDAVVAGAVAIVYEDTLTIPPGVTGIGVRSARQALALLAQKQYATPGSTLRLTGITGTNGKTSISYMLKALLDDADMSTGIIGTLGYDVGRGNNILERTTPEAPELQKYLAAMRDNACAAAVMEVSSHALELERVAGLYFWCTVFTNLSRDHLDFHKTEEAYGQAKLRLFTEHVDAHSTAIINIDDPWGKRIFDATPARVITYGVQHAADIRASHIQLHLDRTTFDIQIFDKKYSITVRLLGMFNVYNTLATLGAALAQGVALENALQSLAAFAGVKGRFEPLVTPRGYAVIIDYAHTPDALEKVLVASRAIGTGRVIVVMGCGGDRDTGKRPQMGAAAVRYADVTVITSDNPRTEDPEAIIADICAGIDMNDTVLVEADRRRAIGRALQAATPGDIVVVAGKGHEDYQIIGTDKIHFDDRETVESFLTTGY